MPHSKPRGACLRNDSTRQRGALTKSSTGLTAEPRVANSQPLALRLYRLGCVLGSPLAPKVLARRLSRGKEHPKRLPERLGMTNIARPKGPLVWIHGASVGEMLAAVSLIERLRAQDFAVLVTSGTVTSAALAEQRLPDGVVHQFVPLDAPRFVQRFLNHWRPGLALFVESDLWPNLICSCAARKVPMIVINGRLSERSFGRWRRVPHLIAALLNCFDLCLTQSPADAERYAKLGAPRVSATGNLKLDLPPLPADEAALHRLKQIVGKRPVVVAASTHPGEEAAVIRAQPMPDIGVYVADTLGELGLMYRLAPVVLMGGSLAQHGGQNPIEAIRLGAAVIHGPHVWNFADIYTALDAVNGAEQVVDEESLAARLGAWFDDPAARVASASAAAAAVQRLSGALERTWAALDPYLMQLRLEEKTS